MARKHPITGASQPQRPPRTAADSITNGSLVGNRRALSFAEGLRGFQERKRSSIGFQSFILVSFQRGSQLLKSIAVSSCHRVRGDFQKSANFFKSILMPNL